MTQDMRLAPAITEHSRRFFKLCGLPVYIWRFAFILHRFAFIIYHSTRARLSLSL